MTARERGLLAAGLLLLAVIGLGLVSRAPAPSVVVGSAEPTPSIPDTALREGVVGRIETLDPLYAPDPAARGGRDRARPGRELGDRRRRAYLDLHAARGRALA